MAQIFAAILALASDEAASAETSIRSHSTETVLRHIWRSEFSAATDSSYRIIRAEERNPVGYFLLGMIYYSLSTQYRTDRYRDSVTWNLDRAIELAKAETKEEISSAESYFVLGSSYGCRALFRSMHGGWWGAFRDGHNSCINLERAYEKDSSLTDAYCGIGAYHYWKSAKSKAISWLPFVGDKRQQGLVELRRGIEARGPMSPNAYKALLTIYCYEKRVADVLALVDTLRAGGLFDTNCRLHVVRALIFSQRWEMAEEFLREVRRDWEASCYYDSCGYAELQFLGAQILAGKGDFVQARLAIADLVSRKRQCEDNVYFQDTHTKARAFLRSIDSH